MNVETVIISRIQERMQYLGTNATQVAAAAGLGKTSVRDIIAGKVKTPTVDTMSRLAHVLNCTIGYLIGEHQNPGGGDSAQFGTLEPRMRPIDKVLRSGVYGASADMDDAEQHLIFQSLTDPGEDLRLDRMGDNNASSVGILKGDLLTSIVPRPHKPTNLVDGIWVVVRRLIVDRGLEEYSLRYVEELNGEIRLLCAPSSEHDVIALSALRFDYPYVDQNKDFIFIVGVVVRIVREM